MAKLLLGKLLCLLHGEIVVGKLLFGEISDWGNCCLGNWLLRKLRWGNCSRGSCAWEITYLNIVIV